MTDLDDEQRALIPHPQQELAYHCAIKGFQAGPVASLILGAPFYAYRLRKQFSFEKFFHRLGRLTIYGTAVSVPLSLTMMYFKLKSEGFNEYKIWDRAYRLRHSATQQRTDRFGYIAAAIGSSLAFVAPLRGRFQLSSAAKGALMAVPFGILAHVITSAQPPTKTDR